MGYAIIALFALCLAVAVLGAAMLVRVMLARANRSGVGRFNVFSQAFHNHAVETGHDGIARKGLWLFLTGFAGALLAFPFLLIVKPLLEN